MPNRSSKAKRETDPNVRAFMTVMRATGQLPTEERAQDTRNPHAVALGKLGGLKGGKARKLALSPARRTAIARVAALKRWSKTAKASTRRKAN